MIYGIVSGLNMYVSIWLKIPCVKTECSFCLVWLFQAEENAILRTERQILRQELEKYVRCNILSRKDVCLVSVPWTSKANSMSSLILFCELECTFLYMHIFTDMHIDGSSSSVQRIAFIEDWSNQYFLRKWQPWWQLMQQYVEHSDSEDIGFLSWL